MIEEAGEPSFVPQRVVLTLIILFTANGRGYSNVLGKRKPSTLPSHFPGMEMLSVNELLLGWLGQLFSPRLWAESCLGVLAGLCGCSLLPSCRSGSFHPRNRPWQSCVGWPTSPGSPGTEKPPTSPCPPDPPCPSAILGLSPPEECGLL